MAISELPNELPIDKLSIVGDIELQNNQPAQRVVERLMAWSRYESSTTNNANRTIINKNDPREQYTISLIQNGRDPRAEEVQKIMEEQFGSAEVDTLKTLQNAIDDDYIPYKIYIVTDNGGNIVSFVTGGQLDLTDTRGNSTGESVWMGAYAVTLPAFERRGLAKEAYISALIDNITDAKKMKKRLTFSAAENVETSEGFSNGIGRKRVYIQTGDKTEFTEVPYVQPPLEYNKKTGHPLKIADSVPEHLMVHRFDGHTPSKAQIASIVRAFYVWNNFKEKHYFHSKRAYETHRQHVEGIFGEFQDFLVKNGQLIMLSPESREKAQHMPPHKPSLQINSHPKMR